MEGIIASKASERIRLLSAVMAAVTMAATTCQMRIQVSREIFIFILDFRLKKYSRFAASILYKFRIIHCVTAS